MTDVVYYAMNTFVVSCILHDAVDLEDTTPALLSLLVYYGNIVMYILLQTSPPRLSDKKNI